jgi:hypothetical protein
MQILVVIQHLLQSMQHWVLQLQAIIAMEQQPLLHQMVL